MTPRRIIRSTDSANLRFAFALLFVVVVAPILCVVWFMTQAMRNERAALRQRWEALGRAHLEAAARWIPELWRNRFPSPALGADQEDAARAFAEAIRSGLCDSLIVHDGEGGVLYPSFPDKIGDHNVEPPDLLAARLLEFGRGDHVEAAKAYGNVADLATTPSVAAQALLAQARCLERTGQRDEAVRIITGPMSQERFLDAADAQGRFIALNARLMVLEWIDDPTSTPFQQAAAKLAERLNDYAPPLPPPSQRRFLMHRLADLWPQCPPFPTAEPERLAAKYLESTNPGKAPGQLVPSGLEGFWQWTPPGERWTALLRTDRIQEWLPEALSETIPTTEWVLRIKPPVGAAPTSASAPHDSSSAADRSSAFLSAPAGNTMPGWSLVLEFRTGDPLEEAAGRRTAVYLGIGIPVIVLALGLGLLLGHSIRRQIRLTRLRNDLIATVSHELKTPLSSIRLLIDTLLEGRCRDEMQKNEYLELVARENARLSRLIDNFLTFSRMERNKHAFQFDKTRPQAVVDEAVEAVRERFAAPDCRLEVDTPPSLPEIDADRDALVTVLVNLLDNAHKYSGARKVVRLRTRLESAAIRFTVEDNGVGIPKRARKRIFERFYQVDQRLSRTAGGCGLGLSIVRFIVEAHGGEIQVESEPGRGSIFTVIIPCARAEAAN